MEFQKIPQASVEATLTKGLFDPRESMIQQPLPQLRNASNIISSNVSREGLIDPILREFVIPSLTAESDFPADTPALAPASEESRKV